MRTKRVVLILWLLLVRASFLYAQTEGKPAQWSVGLQATAQRYEVRYPISGLNEISFIPAQLTVGYRLTSRLLVQVGVAYRKESLNNYFLLDSATVERTRTTETYRSVVVPLTARYTVSHNLEKRLLLDVVGGVALFHSTHNFSQLSYTVPRIITPTEEGATKSYFTFGLSGHYRFNSHLEGVLDLLLNKATAGGSTLSPRFYNAALGVRYAF